VSGIVGIVNFDRAPLDAILLRDMTQSMAFRGPDVQQTWADSYVGLGHAMLRTTFEMANEQQPCSLEGQVWITADARIDARKELIRDLEAKGCSRLSGATDTELILYAYRTWDTNCVHHLLGDFVFAIWDIPRQRLFCARDHFGVRPFYYAEVGGCLIFSNNFDTIRRHPSVSVELNDLAILNFLLFKYQPRIDQTALADIQSLLPGHILVWEGRSVTISCYWTLPIEEPIRYSRRLDYVDHFRQLLDSAVADRMRTDRAGILMSGGTDSSSIAATMHSLRVRKGSKFAVEAITCVYDRLIPDEERRYASLVAGHLDMPIRFEVMDDRKWFDGWDREGFCYPEPMVNSPLWNDENGVRKAALNDGFRVFHSGSGPDLMLNEPAQYGTMLRHGLISGFVRGAGAFIVRYRLRPFIGAKQLLKRLRGDVPGTHADIDALALLAPELAGLIKIPKQWWQFPTQRQTHPWRPYTYSQLTDHFWTIGFQQFDAANWRAPVEFRYPYFDLRLVRYLLRVPVLPSFSNKALLREAMLGKLPETVRVRPKAPLAGEPKHSYADWVHSKKMPDPRLTRYVDARRAMWPLPARGTLRGINIEHRLIALNHWLERYGRPLSA
jgi:asparagine synthase (glutamine-hydrolysing)